MKHSVNDLKLKVKELEKQFTIEKGNKSISNLSTFTNNAITIKGISTIIAITNDYEVPVLKQIIDALGNKFDKYFILLANVNGTNANFVCISNEDAINCGAIVKELALKSKGNGGGSKNFAQGGGTDISELSVNLQEIKEYLRNL